MRAIVACERRFRRYDLAYMAAALSIVWTSLAERDDFALFTHLPTLLRTYSRDHTYIMVSLSLVWFPDPHRRLGVGREPDYLKPHSFFMKCSIESVISRRQN